MKHDETDYSKPVAYDNEGRPLYAHPPKDHSPQSVGSVPVQNVVHVARPIDPDEPEISNEAQQRHEEAKRRYPTLNLSKGEYIISEVRRHWIGLLLPIILGGVLMVVILVALVSYPLLVPSNNPPFESVVLPCILLLVLVALITYIITWVYLNNKFFLTNESVIQEIQVSLFARNEQTVSLENIEDASFTQTGIIQHLFNYGSIRLSTEGDETTYRFHYVSNPKHQIVLLNNAVEAFKAGRPVTGD